MADVLFKGYFDLSTALNEFGKFAKDVEFRLRKIYENVRQDKADAGYGVFGTNKAQVARAEKEIKESQNRVGDGFVNLAIRSYALHQFGNFLNQTVTQPLIRLKDEIIQTTLRFDTLEKLLVERGNRSMKQVGETIDLVGRTAKLRNLDLEMTVTLYSRLFEATRGAIDDKTFETLAKGLSQVMTTIESGEKRAFFGQIQDVLGGGNVANLERTLSLAPALKTVYDEIQATTEVALSQQEALMMSFERLAGLPALTDLQTKVKNIRVEFELMAYRIGQIYKDEFEQIVDFITDRVIPAIDNLLDRFQQAPELVQNLIAVLGVAAAIIAPILSTLGTFVLLFPSATAESAFVGQITGFLTKLPSLLNPITAIIAALVAILAKAFSENAGGFRDALNYLVDILGGTFWNILKGLYDTLTSIVAIFVNFYNLIDSIIPLTTTIGVIATGLAYILATLISLVNLIAIIPTTLRFIADLLSGDIDLAFERFMLNIYKMLDALGPIAKLIELVFGVDLKQKIKDAEVEVARLDKTTKNLADSTELTKEQQDALQLAFEQNKNSIKSLTDAIKAQNDAIDEQILKNRQLAREREAQLDRFMAQSRQASYLDTVDSADLTSIEGKEKARDALGSFTASVDVSAQAERSQRIQKNLREFLGKQREAILNAIQKETTESGEKLDADTKALYLRYAEYLKQVIFGNVDITDENYQAFIYKRLQEQITKSKGNEAQLRLLFGFIQNERTLFQQVRRGEIKNIQETIKAAEVIGNKKRELQQKIEEAEAEDQKVRQLAPLGINLTDLEGQIDRLRDARDNYAELAGEVQDLTQFLNTLASYETELLKANDRRAKILVEMAEIEQETEAKRRAEKDKIEQDRQGNQLQIQAESQKKRNDILKKILGTEITQRQELNKLYQELQGLYQERIDLTRQAGIQLDPKTFQDFNKNLDAMFANDVEPKLQRLKRIVEASRDAFMGTNEVFAGLSKIGQGIKLIGQNDLSNPTKRKEFLDQAQVVQEILQKYLDTATQVGDEQGAAQIQIFIKAYIDLVETLRKGEGVLTQKLDANLQGLLLRESELERQRQIVELTENELDLTREILNLRKEAGQINVKDLKGLGKQILDVLSGGRLSDYEIEKQIIEQKIAAAKLELEISILRLQIEMEILVAKLRAAGVSEAEIQKVRTQYESLIDKIKEEGELRRILLDEQMKGLEVFSGSFGDVLFQGIAKALSKLLGQEDEPRVTVLDDEGNEQEIEDPLAGAADSTDDTADAVDDLDAKYAKLSKTVGTVAKAILNMNDLSLKSIRNAVAATLDAIAQEALVRALQYAAIAISAAVFGDWGTAGRAAAAAAAWGAVAIAAKLGADFIRTSDEGSSANSSASASRSAGVSAGEYDPDRDPAILRQKALSVFIALDIRTDDGIIIKKNIKAINQNTELTNLIANSSEGWAFAPTV